MKEYLKLKPAQRAELAEKLVICGVQKAGVKGITTGRLVNQTRLSRATVEKYLLKLVALKTVRKEVKILGDVSVAFYSAYSCAKA